MQVPGSFHQAPGLLGDVAFFFFLLKGVCVSSLRVQRGPPPTLPSFLSKDKVGRKRRDSSHWPQGEAAALRREGKMYKKPPIFTPGEGKGEGGAFL